ncbi:MAG TPA: hypothetical protein VF546_06525 [Pyrinomonadaceae bacterium]|jgi:hypothetical protein
MKKQFLIAAALVCQQALALAQPPTQTQTPPPRAAAPPRPAPAAQRTSFDLADYGIQLAPDERLIVVMAALDAAGFDPPAGRIPNVFRAELRKEQANLDPDLKRRLQRFYELNRLPGRATPAEQAARYVSLAFALTPPPELAAPARADDLSQGILDVLDFAPLVREFYRQSGVGTRLPAYVRQYRDAGDRLRPQTADLARVVLAFLHTRPVTTVLERVATHAPSDKQKKGAQPTFTTREHERRFVVVPDLLAAPGAINLRVVGDDYFLALAPNVDPRVPEVRRAYLQFLIDPIVLRYNRDVAARRADLRELLKQLPSAPREQATGAVTTATTGPPAATAAPKTTEERERFIDSTAAEAEYERSVFTAVTRSLVVAADAQMLAGARQRALTEEAAARLAKANAAERAGITQELQAARAAVEDEKTAQLADAYERGAVLAFYFAEQLREQDTSGFDLADLFADMLARFDVAREKRRLTEAAPARARALAVRQRLAEAESAAAAAAGGDEDEQSVARRARLVQSLDEATELIKLKKYEEAETRLKGLMPEYQGEPRIFYALGQVSYNAARDTFDEDRRAEQLGRALANYRFAVEHAQLDIEAERALASRAHVAMGRILAFLDRNDEALKEFDAALQLGDVPSGAYREAGVEKSKLQAPPPQ